MFGRKDENKEWAEKFQENLAAEYYRYKRDLEATTKMLEDSTILKILTMMFLETTMNEIHTDMENNVDPKESALRLLARMKK